jgi:hypothetical protein
MVLEPEKAEFLREACQCAIISAAAGATEVLTQQRMLAVRAEKFGNYAIDDIMQIACSHHL